MVLPDWLKRAPYWVSTATVCLIFLAYALGTDSFNLPKWLVLILAAAATVLLGMAKLAKSRHLQLDITDLSATAFCLWAWLSLWWSPDPLSGLEKAGLISALVAIFMFVRHGPHELISSIIPLACVASISIIMLRLSFSPELFGGFGNENYVTEFLLLAAPYLVFWWWSRETPDRWIAPLVLAYSAFYLCFMNQSRLEFAILPVMIVVFSVIALIKGGRPKFAGFMGIGAIIVAIAACIVLWNFPALQDSLQHRGEFFSNTIRLWLDKPLFGHGLGGFVYEYPRVQQSHLPGAYDQHSGALSHMFATLKAAHNDYLQLLTELGTVGLAIGMIALITILTTVFSGQLESLQIAAMASAVGAMCLAMVVFPFQNPATATIAVMSLAIMGRGPSASSESQAFFRTTKVPCLLLLPAAIGGAVLVGGWTVGASAAYRGSWHANLAEISRHKDAGKRYAETLRAYAAFPLSNDYRRALFVNLVGWAEETGRLPVLPSEFDRIYRISLSAGPYAPGTLFARSAYLGMLPASDQRKAEGNRIIGDLKMIVPHLPEVYVFEADHALRFGETDRARRSLDKAERIGTLSPQIRKMMAGLRRRLGR